MLSLIHVLLHYFKNVEGSCCVCCYSHSCLFKGVVPYCQSKSSSHVHAICKNTCQIDTSLQVFFYPKSVNVLNQVSVFSCSPKGKINSDIFSYKSNFFDASHSFDASTYKCYTLHSIEKIILKCKSKVSLYVSLFEEGVGSYHSVCLIIWFSSAVETRINRARNVTSRWRPYFLSSSNTRTPELGRARSHNIKDFKIGRLRTAVGRESGPGLSQTAHVHLHASFPRCS